MAGQIPEEFISDLRERADILEVISQYVPVKKAGSGFKGLCPFHQESTPSFHVNPQKQFFYCFGCGAGGNVFHFLMKINNLSFPEAVEELATRYRVQVPRTHITKDEEREAARRQKLIEVNEAASRYFARLLRSPKGTDARSYLRARGLDREIIEQYRLGVSDKGWDGLCSFFSKEGISLELAEKVGLVIRSQKGGFYDRFRGRIMFPIFNEQAQVIGFGGRALDDGTPKYLNSPESEIFKKGYSLYGLDKAKAHIREAEFAIVVEGYMDLLSLSQFGFRNTVAALGTALTLEQIRLIKRYTKTLVLVFDGDEAGAKATSRSLELLLDEGVFAKGVRLPEGDDPDSYVRRVGKDGFQRSISEAAPLMHLFMDYSLKQTDQRTIEGRLKCLETVIPMLKKVRSDVERDYYVDRLSRYLDIRPQRIQTMIKADQKELRVDAFQEGVRIDPAETERLLVQLMLLHPDYIPIVEKQGIVEDFADPPNRSLAQVIIQRYRAGKGVDPSGILDDLEELSMVQMVSNLVMTEGRITEPDKIFNDCIRTIKRRRIDQKRKELEHDLKEAERNNDHRRIEQLSLLKMQLRFEKEKLIHGFE